MASLDNFARNVLKPFYLGFRAEAPISDKDIIVFPFYKFIY